MAWMPPQKPGDVGILIPSAKKYLDRFSYGHNLGDSDEYTIEFGVRVDCSVDTIFMVAQSKYKSGTVAFSMIFLSSLIIFVEWSE